MVNYLPTGEFYISQCIAIVLSLYKLIVISHLSAFQKCFQWLFYRYLVLFIMLSGVKMNLCFYVLVNITIYN